jgi:prepilin-type N-terminal cleavage/methylation domain-containing protein
MYVIRGSFSVTSKRGFTLMELLIVISLLGLLALVIFGNMWQARVKGQVAATKQQLHEIQNSMELYLAEYGDYPPLAGETNILANPSTAHPGDHCSMCEFAPNGTLHWHGAKWSGIGDILTDGHFIGDAPAIYEDPWGNPYLYDKNYRQSCYTLSPICSTGPNGVFEQPTNCPTSKIVFGDDICVFLEDDPNDGP